MLYRYGKKNSGGWDFGKQSERYHIPTLIKSRRSTSDRVASFGLDKDQNYKKFTRRVRPGSIVWVIVWDDKLGRFCIKKSTVCSVFFFDYDRNGSLWNVWLDNYHHNTGLLEDSEYFLTRQRAQWFLNHQMSVYHSFKENKEYWESKVGEYHEGTAP